MGQISHKQPVMLNDWIYKDKDQAYKDQDKDKD